MKIINNDMILGHQAYGLGGIIDTIILSSKEVRRRKKKEVKGKKSTLIQQKNCLMWLVKPVIVLGLIIRALEL